MHATKNSTKKSNCQGKYYDWRINFYVVKRVILTGLFFSETAVSTDVIAEVSTRHQVNYQVQVVAVFERVVHVHKESIQTKVNNLRTRWRLGVLTGE